VLLGEEFFRAASVAHRADQTIELRIRAAGAEQVASLRALDRGTLRQRGRLAYAHQEEAGLVDVQSVESESTRGATVFTVTLRPDEKALPGSSLSEASVNGYSADEIAGMRARLLLLNERPAGLPRAQDTWLMSFVGGHSGPVTVKQGLFPKLWATLKLPPSEFLPRARLMAVYQLKASHTVEDVLELRLGPITKGAMGVRFRGRRRRVYENQAPATIEVAGTCALVT
jgi:hypothetical protein